MTTYALALLGVLMATSGIACGGKTSDDEADSSSFVDAGLDGDLDAVIEVDPDALLREPKIHRPTADACTAPRPPGNVHTTGDAGPDSCNGDTQCTAGTNGRCDQATWTPVCTYDTCFGDADCKADELCACRGTPGGVDVYGIGAENETNICRHAACHVDADCGAPGHGYCSPSYVGFDCTGLDGWFCHTPYDQCVDAEDCAPPTTCEFDVVSGRWACGSICGRAG